MSFGDLDSGKRAKQWCGEDSSFAQAIRTNVVDMQTTIRDARLHLEQAHKLGCRMSKRVDESLRKSLSRGDELAEKTEQVFREWTVHLAGEPTTRHKRKLSYEKLQKAFTDEVDCLKELHRQANALRQNLASSGSILSEAGSSAPILVRTNQNRSAYDEEQGLLAASEVHRAEDDVSNTSLVQSSIAHDREERIMRISSQVVDVNQMFRDLASIVHEQDEKFETIEQHAQSAATNGSLAVKELKKTSDRQRFHSERLCCLLASAILVFCFVLFSNMSHLHAWHQKTFLQNEVAPSQGIILSWSPFDSVSWHQGSLK
jgi:hypothetical protein